MSRNRRGSYSSNSDYDDGYSGDSEFDQNSEDDENYWEDHEEGDIRLSVEGAKLRNQFDKLDEEEELEFIFENRNSDLSFLDERNFQQGTEYPTSLLEIINKALSEDDEFLIEKIKDELSDSEIKSLPRNILETLDLEDRLSQSEEAVLSAREELEEIRSHWTPQQHRMREGIINAVSQRSAKPQIRTNPKNDYLRGKKIEGEKLRSESEKFNIITVFEDGRVEVSQSSVGTGMDEHFKTSKSSRWRELDQELQIEGNEANFTKCFLSARIRTHEYIHPRGVGGETTGHPGGLFGEGKKKGSPGFHKDRDNVIENIISSDSESSRKPIEATIAAFRFVINNTIGYKDLQNSNIKFSGITASGLDLSQLEDREHALKFFQAVRDKYKATILKLKGKEIDLAEDSLDDVREKSESEGFSPPRFNTPYSQTLFESTTEELKLARTFEDTLNVSSDSKPTISPGRTRSSSLGSNSRRK